VFCELKWAGGQEGGVGCGGGAVRGKWVKDRGAGQVAISQKVSSDSGDDSHTNRTRMAATTYILVGAR
jgi:hypothetical protein